MKKLKQIVLILILLLLIFVGYYFLTQDKPVDSGKQFQVPDGQMAVTYLDVGQGDCTVVRMGGQTMVIDAGDNDAGQNIVNYLTKNGITTIDLMILTHPDVDHIGGADDVIKSIYVKKVLMPDMSKGTFAFAKLEAAFIRRNTEIVYPKVGEEYTFGEARFTILCPQRVQEEEFNNSSLGIKLVYGSRSFVMCGDAEVESEAEMVKLWGDELQCDVLKCGHHGSYTATSQKYLDAANPIWAVISCGRWNLYGHPHASVMKRLQKKGVQIMRTDQLGTLTAFCDGETIYWDSQYQLE